VTAESNTLAAVAVGWIRDRRATAWTSPSTAGRSEAAGFHDDG
jgi:hypothetical protein